MNYNSHKTAYLRYQSSSALSSYLYKCRGGNRPHFHFWCQMALFSVLSFSKRITDSLAVKSHKFLLIFWEKIAEHDQFCQNSRTAVCRSYKNSSCFLFQIMKNERLYVITLSLFHNIAFTRFDRIKYRPVYRKWLMNVRLSPLATLRFHTVSK